MYKFGRSSRLIVPFLTAGVAVGQALSMLKKLRCWVVKQLKVRSAILNQVLTGVDTISHCTLQNKAALVFLLAHGHECEDFEGMCVLNLSNHSAVIPWKLKQGQDNMKKLIGNERVTHERFERWETTRWLKDLVKGTLLLLVVIIILLLVIPCIMKLVSVLEENRVERV